jgi:hypothetical protein
VVSDRYRFLPVDRLDFRDVFREPLRDGTFAPLLLASLRPIAMACLRLVTLRPEPLFSDPFFLRRIADSTFFDADLPYLAMLASRSHALQTAC